MRWPKGIRGRAAILATAMVAVALAVAGFVLSQVVERNLLSNLETTLQQQADDRLRLLTEGADPQTLTGLTSSEAFVVINQGSESVSAGVNGWLACASNPCIVDVRLEESGEEEDDELHTVMAVAAINGDTAVVIGSELEQVSGTVNLLRWALAIGILLLVALTGYIIWITVGRVLAPVEAIREQASSIRGSSLDRRVPESGSGDEIDRLAGTVNEMLARIAHHDATRRQFASDASHELKSPLANLRAMIDTAKGDEWATVSASAATEVDRMGSLVDDLLFLSMADEETTTTTAVDRVHLDDVVFDEIEVLAAGSDVRIDGSGVTPVSVVGDRRLLSRAFRNLIDNAVRHAAGTVKIAASASDVVRVIVEDDGPGIPPEWREMIFDRFVRLDGARSRGTGSTGLGLAIVKEIIERHGGSVIVEDSTLGGARFVVELPI